MVIEVPSTLRRTAHKEDDTWLASARHLIALGASVVGAPDLGDVRVLDMGCGTKIVKVLVEEGRPIGRYVGIDTERQVVELLRSQVDDDRFSFHHIDAYNELYNRDGTRLEDFPSLPVDPDERFDLVQLFSVFTHLDPADYRTMLRLLRPHVADDGRLLFSLYVKDFSTRGGLNRLLQELDSGDMTSAPGFVDALFDRIAERDVVVIEQFRAGIEPRLDELDPDAADVLRSAFAAADAGRSWDEILDGLGIATPPEGDHATTAAVLGVPEGATFETDEHGLKYLDAVPAKPLLMALYREDYAYELLEGTGWEPVSLNPPELPHIQHYFVCRPI